MSVSKMSEFWERAKAWLDADRPDDEQAPEPVAEVVQVQRAQSAQPASGPSWLRLESIQRRQRWPEEVLAALALASLAGLCAFGLAAGEPTPWARLASGVAAWLAGDVALLVPGWLAFGAWRLFTRNELSRRAAVTALFVAFLAAAGIAQLIGGGLRSGGMVGLLVAWATTQAVGSHATPVLGLLTAGCLLAAGWALFVRLVARFAPEELAEALDELPTGPEPADDSWAPPPPDLLARGSG